MTTAGTWYPPSCGTGGFLIELTNPPFTMTDHTEQTQTPELPPEVFAELLAEANRATRNRTEHGALLAELARLAYAAGADAELEACCEWLERGPLCFSAATKRALRSARRPKPPSLKEQALDDLNSARQLAVPQPDGSCTSGGILLSDAQAAAIRRALESLPDPQ